MTIHTEVYDHLDTLNDIVLECTCRATAEHEVKRYCETYDLDPAGFDVLYIGEAYVVEIAE